MIQLLRFASVLFMAVTLFLSGLALPATAQNLASAPSSATVVSLDGAGWQLATDPKNVGRDEKWFSQPAPDARQTKVPWIIQDVFPDYHGVVWYWRTFQAPPLPDPQARYLLRFWAVSYYAEVWVNGVPVGNHEGGETPFTLDVTDAIKAGGQNLVAVRVLNPSAEPIDGMVLQQVPHRNQTLAFTTGCDYDHGGIEDSVQLLVTPAQRIDQLFCRADPNTGVISIQADVVNSLSNAVNGDISISVSPATTGETIATQNLNSSLNPGHNLVQMQVALDNPRLWELNDPFLYRISVKVSVDGAGISDEESTRCGFRDFRIENGYFRLNGRRIFLRSSVSGDMSPIGIHVPYDRDWFRRDLINTKAMGFNAIRFYGLPTRFQLDLCDELGLLVYEEPFSSQGYENSPQMARRFDNSTAGMILRDRNHPSVVMWGLLNETGDCPQFRHAVQTLGLVRSLDPSRLVMLSSGRFDLDLSIGSVSNPGSTVWQCLLGNEGVPPAHPLKMIYPSCEGTGDAHIYPQVPHKADAIHLLRTFGDDTVHKHVFLSEYGIASAVDFVRVVKQYEQRGKGDCGECQFYRRALDQFLVDWKRWNMEDTFGRPDDYFDQCLAAVAEQRITGINALRSNPAFIGYDLTGTSDQGYAGEGPTTAFREFKPGSVDAIFDGLAPLRWCLFAEPVNLYSGHSVKLDAVLADEDVLKPGDYPVRLEVFGPDNHRVFDRTINLTIPDPHGNPEPPLAIPAFSENITANWPAGKYRFTATFEGGAAPAGRAAEFYVVDPLNTPLLDRNVVLWGDDPVLAKWLADHQISYRQFDANAQTTKDVILVGNAVPAPGGAEAFKDLAARIAGGATAIFLDPNVFAAAGQADLLALGKKGKLISIEGDVYHPDRWAKKHPIFDGLPSGGLLNDTIYREVIGNQAWHRDDVPGEAIAGSIFALPAYASGLLVSADTLGSGRFILNTLLIRENLERDPTADRLLWNMLRYAARDSGSPAGQ